MSAESLPDEVVPPRRARRKTGPYAAADARREAILDAAIEHFAHWGFFNSSMPAIAASVGISRAGLLHHFGSKEALLAAVLTVREKRAAETFYLPVGGAPGAVQLFRSVVAQAAFNVTQPGLTQMFSVLAAEASNEEHPAHEYFQQRYARVTAFMSRVLRDAQADGSVVASADPVGVAEEILAVSDGFAIQWALREQDFDLEARVFGYMDRLCRTLLATGESLRAPA